jgi:hypothetical protein
MDALKKLALRWSGLLSVMLTSFFWGYGYHRTGALWPWIFIHAASDLVGLKVLRQRQGSVDFHVHPLTPRPVVTGEPRHERRVAVDAVVGATDVWVYGVVRDAGFGECRLAEYLADRRFHGFHLEGEDPCYGGDRVFRQVDRLKSGLATVDL